jgi:beta-lactamase regulating signal transducer with metallopeptidase domain
MNSFIETLNQWGGIFLNFAWPMFWQSSLLIIVLSAFDFLFRRKVRTSIRYALWLVVLVKLCVPPTLALPTSPAWWLHQTSPSIVAKPTPHYNVTYDNGPLPETPQAALPAFVPPKPAMNPAAWLLVVSTSIGLALLGWLLVRWWQITRQVRHAKTSERLAALANEAQIFIGTKFNVQVKLTTNSMSPAVCGLFRPTILIPQSLVEHFSDGQLRAVLLHELIHLRRRDVWLNFVQALLQIFYWWHPLVWLANARIRRVREEAVDDTVMLALRDDAESYAPTLLEVAKLALNRPLASLGLVGILESRHALRQRIERLVDFRPPRKAGLTLASLLGILAFTAVAVPMGNAPDKPLDLSALDGLQTLTVKVNPEVFLRNVKAQAVNYMHATNDDWASILIDILRCEGVDGILPDAFEFNLKAGEMTAKNSPDALEVFRQIIEQLNRPDGKGRPFVPDSSYHRSFHPTSVLIKAQFYAMRTADFKKLIGYADNVSFDPGNYLVAPIAAERFAEFNQKIKSLGLSPFSSPRVQTGHGILAELYTGVGTNGVHFDCLPYISAKGIELAFRANVIGDLSANGITLVGTANHAVKGRVMVQNHDGIIVCANNSDGSVKNNLVVVLEVQMVTNLPAAKAGGLGQIDPRIETNANLTTVTGILTDPNFRVVLNALQQQTGSQTMPEPEVTTRSGHHVNWIGTDNISAPLPDPVSESSNQISMIFTLNHPIRQDELKEKLLIAGVKIPPTVFFYQDNGKMLGRGTVEQLALVERLMMSLNGYPSKDSEADTEQFIKQISDIGESPISPMTNLLSRHFRVDTKKFIAGLRKATGSQTDNVSTMARCFFSTLGVDLDLPGKAIFFSDGLGELFVRATANDLDTVETALEVFITLPPQIHIKARFLEVPKESLALLRPFPELTNGVTIVSATSFRKLMQTLESNPGAETLAEPEVVTTSGRQTQMRATILQTIVSGVSFDMSFVPSFSTNDSSKPAIAYKSQNLEIGPIFDTVATVLSDGYRMQLRAIPSLTEFFGYAPSSNSLPSSAFTNLVALPVIYPSVRVQRADALVNLWDGQTLVFNKFKTKSVGAENFPKNEDKELLVFITVTLVDPAGNRIHSDEEMPFVKDTIPPQPK